MAAETPIPPVRRKSPTESLTFLVAGVVVVAALYVGAGIFVPLVLAVLLTFALSPVVRFMYRRGLPQIIAVLVTVAVAAALLGVVSYLLVGELSHLAADLPKYQQVVAAKLHGLQQSAAADSTFSRIAGAIEGAISSVAPTDAGTAPLPVTVVNPAEGPLAVGSAFLGSLLGPLATAAIVVVLVVFLLLEREDFRDRFLKLVSRGDLRTTTRAMTEAARRVSRYLLIQLAVNVGYGAAFGVGLYFIGVPDALLWGLLTALFRYIPFVGTLLGVVFPAALAFAIDPQWTMLIEVVALYFGLEIVVTNAIEPRLYGSSTGLSALAILLAAMFWASLWGPIGLILATPLTVCLVVLGRYVPQLQFLETMLGSEPVLVREEQLYQRLVSGNAEEAIELAEQYVADGGTAAAFYDDVALPALRLANGDRDRGADDLAGRRLVAAGMEAVVHELDTMPEDDPISIGSRLVVACIGGRTELDAAAANMLAKAVASAGVEVRVLPPVSLRPEGIGQIDLAGVDAVCIVYLGGNANAYLRYAQRRLKRLAPAVEVIGCLFDGGERTEGDAPVTVAPIASSVAEATALVLKLAPVAPVVDVSARERALEHLRLHAHPGPALDAFTSAVAGEFGAQIAVVAPAPREEEAAGGVGQLRELVMKSSAGITFDAANKTHADDLFLVENAFSFFAGVPILDNGEAVGALMIFDHEVRSFSEEEMLRLQEYAARFLAGADATAGLPLAVAS